MLSIMMQSESPSGEFKAVRQTSVISGGSYLRVGDYYVLAESE
jgi:hypothetical protein